MMKILQWFANQHKDSPSKQTNNRNRQIMTKMRLVSREFVNVQSQTCRIYLHVFIQKLQPLTVLGFVQINLPNVATKVSTKTIGMKPVTPQWKSTKSRMVPKRPWVAHHDIYFLGEWPWRQALSTVGLWHCKLQTSISLLITSQYAENLSSRENPSNEAVLVRIQDDRQHAGLPNTLGLQRWLLDSFPHGALLWPLILHRPSGLHIATCRKPTSFVAL